MKKISFLLVFLFSFNFFVIGQVDEEEGQFFGGKRAIKLEAFSQYDFGSIKEPVVTHEFIIRNPTPNPMTIKSIDIPDGVSITVVNKVIKPQEAGKIIVVINKKYFKKTGVFQLPIIVRTKQKMGKGLSVYKEAVYLIRGSIE